MQGKVLDPARAPIAGARVAAPDAGGASVRSNQNGEFALGLEAGSYTLKIAAEGFREATRTIHLAAGGCEPLEIVLEIIPMRSAVTVIENAGYLTTASNFATKTLTPLRDVPQSITIVSQELMRDQMMMSIGDVVRYVPGITAHQGENNRDQVVIRGNNSSADFFVNGVRDDAQYFRDLYNLDHVEALKGPNAMVFGRGGGGGVVNRVTKQAGFQPLHEIAIQGGSFGNKRLTGDFDQPLSGKLALRLNAMYENSDSFRNGVGIERYGVSPALTITPGTATRLLLSYEYLHDGRVADRGIPSYLGRPVDIAPSTYFGDPRNSPVRAGVNLGSAMIEHQAGMLNIRNRTMIGDYDRGYQNYVPGALNADKTQVPISAYNNSTRRRNAFNQTDVVYTLSTGRVRHTILGGAEAGRQLTDNFRNSGYFNGTSTTIQVPYANPTVSAPVTFRQSASDADNYLAANVVATYVQDQIELSSAVQVIAGLRFDHFDLRYHNNRSGDSLRRIDNLVSPRAGVVFKPMTSLSFYTNYSVSFLPSSGDQFSSLTTITQQVKPERFTNYEAGVKWDVSRNLFVTSAAYRLDRTNTRSTDPNDPTRIVQTGSQRTNGYELGLTGSVTHAWKIAGGYAWQDAFISSATVAALAGAQVPQVPSHTFSVWNNYQIVPRLGAGLGVLHRTAMYAAVDNAVTLPGYTRADAALYYSITERVRLQANVENLFDTRYFMNADGNNNISPGFPRTLRIGLIARF